MPSHGGGPRFRLTILHGVEEIHQGSDRFQVPCVVIFGQAAHRLAEGNITLDLGYESLVAAMFDRHPVNAAIDRAKLLDPFLLPVVGFADKPLQIAAQQA